MRRLAGAFAVPHRTLRWTGEKPATGLQEAARAARYRLLAAAAHEAGARHVLTAHTLDDQAETVLMRMARGSGPTGLAGMARHLVSPGLRGEELTLVRPFLDVPKARLIATLAAAGIAFAEDPSNRDPRFTRARLRGLMPALAAGRARCAPARNTWRGGFRAPRRRSTSRSMRLARGSRANLGPDRRRSALDAAGFAVLPAEVALRLLGRAIAQVGDEGPVELGKLEALFAALLRPVHGETPSPRFPPVWREPW